MNSLDTLTDNNSNNYTLNEGATFNNYLAFETTVKNYAKQIGFTVRLDSAKYNEMREIRWRDIICSRSGLSNKMKKEKNQETGVVENSNTNTRNRPSQRCECPFFVCGILNKD